MKIFEDVLRKAVSIANNDPEAFVAVFDLRVKHKIADCKDWAGGGLFKLQTMQYISPRGGKVLFFDAGHDVWPNIAGYQFTHVFCSEFVDMQSQRMIKSRIRFTKKPHPEPSGFYNFYGVVERTEVW